MSEREKKRSTAPAFFFLMRWRLLRRIKNSLQH